MHRDNCDRGVDEEIHGTPSARTCGGQGHRYTSRVAPPLPLDPAGKVHTRDFLTEKFYECLLERSCRIRVATKTSAQLQERSWRGRAGGWEGRGRHLRVVLGQNSRDARRTESFGPSYQVPRRGRYYTIAIFDIPSAGSKCPSSTKYIAKTSRRVS